MKKKAKNLSLFLTLCILVVLLITDIVNKDDKVISENTVDDEFFLVSRVIDGDTFVIETGEKIRMIGMDTPEKGKYFYTDATERLKELIADKRVVLKKDISETDRYGRLLRHVYVEDVWINKQMIDEGYARFVTFPPDVFHVDIFKQAQENAREKGVGLWEK